MTVSVDMPMDYDSEESSYSDSALLDDPVEETGDTGAGESSLITVDSPVPEILAQVI